MITPHIRRPFLAMTMLLCTVTLTACLDEGCNPTSPSETAGSHQEDTASLFIALHYTDAFTEGLEGDETIKVTIGRAGTFTVTKDRPAFAVLDDVGRGEAFAITINGTLAGTCAWKGETKVFGTDAAIDIEASGVVQGFRVYSATCRGWGN